MTIFLILIGQR